MSSSDSKYVKRWLLWSCSMLTAAVALNLAVDPYGIYRIVEIDGLNGFKSRAGQRGAQFKHALLERHRPDVIILGNSRAEVGFDPEHPALARGGRGVNLALPGTGIETAAAFLLDAITVHPPKLAIIGVDLLDARVDARSQPATAGDRMAVRAPDPWWRSAANHVGTLASIDALYDALSTLRDNRREDTPGLTALGFNPMRDYPGIARRDGYHQLFEQRDIENARNFARGPRGVFTPGSRTSPYLETVRDLVALCRKERIELHLVIYPYHAHMLELFHATHLWAAFEDWKTALVGIVLEQAAAEDTPPIRLWDFSGYTTFATEPVPAPTDRRTRMRWYWEAGHFKKELGDILLDRILARPTGLESTGDAFGAVLETGKLESHLLRIRAGRDAYRRIHAEEVLALDELVRAVTAK